MSAVVSGLVGAAIAFAISQLAERRQRRARLAPDGWRRLSPGWFYNGIIALCAALAMMMATILISGGSTRPDADVQNRYLLLLAAGFGAAAIYGAWSAYCRTIMWKGDELRVRTRAGREAVYQISDISSVTRHEMRGEHRLTFRDGSHLWLPIYFRGASELVSMLSRTAPADGGYHQAKVRYGTVMSPSFYRRLWRFNAFAIAGLALPGMVASFLIAADWFGRLTKGEDSPIYQGLDHPVLSEEVIEGSLFRTIRVGDQPNNMLLIDDRDGSSRYALPDNSRDIIQWHNLPRAEDPPAEVQAYVALVRCVQPATAEAECYDVLVGRLDQPGQAWVAKGVSALEWPKLVDDESVAMLIWVGDEMRYLKVGLSDMKPQISRPVPFLEPRAGNAPRPSN